MLREEKNNSKNSNFRADKLKINETNRFHEENVELPI